MGYFGGLLSRTAAYQLPKGTPKPAEPKTKTKGKLTLTQRATRIANRISKEHWGIAPYKGVVKGYQVYEPYTKAGLIKTIEKLLEKEDRKVGHGHN